MGCKRLEHRLFLLALPLDLVSSDQVKHRHIWLRCEILQARPLETRPQCVSHLYIGFSRIKCVPMPDHQNHFDFESRRCRASGTIPFTKVLPNQQRSWAVRQAASGRNATQNWPQKHAIPAARLQPAPEVMHANNNPSDARAPTQHQRPQWPAKSRDSTSK